MDRRKGEHLGYLDGLRGIAIAMVVMVHVGQRIVGMPVPIRDFTFYGVRGVQLFFIVSGFTLAMTHFGKPLNLANFAARRFFRIAPMFYIGACLYLGLAAIPVLDPAFNPQGVTFGAIALTASFLHGWSLKSYNLVVPGGWSIADEAMFYCLFPFLLLMLGNRRRYGALLVAIYVLAGMCYFALRRFVPGDPRMVQGFAASFWLCNLPAFATGCWLALKPGFNALNDKARLIAVLAGLGIVMDSQLRGHGNLLISIMILSALVWAVDRAPPAWLRGRFMTRLGEISFSLYLLHFAVLKVLLPWIHREEAAIGWAAALPLAYVATIAVAGLLAHFTYEYVERPFIRIGRKAFAGSTAETPPLSPPSPDEAAASLQPATQPG
jgi:peptidoglycan/LPS O-acetylase OafA/YrhL